MKKLTLPYETRTVDGRPATIIAIHPREKDPDERVTAVVDGQIHRYNLDGRFCSEGKSTLDLEMPNEI